jgi:hypothetical protein
VTTIGVRHLQHEADQSGELKPGWIFMANRIEVVRPRGNVVGDSGVLDHVTPAGSTSQL